MSQQHKLQGSIYNPRKDSKDRRIPQTHATHRTTGEDGKLYSLADEADYSKYKVLDEEGIELEERHASDLKASIALTSGKSRTSSDGLAKSITVGNASRDKKISNSKWMASLPPNAGAHNKTHDVFEGRSNKGAKGTSLSPSPTGKGKGSTSPSRAGKLDL